MITRLMKTSDLDEVAKLCEQFGYISTLEQVKYRFNQLENDIDHGLFVVEGYEHKIVGWLQVHGRKLIGSDSFAEIGGIVVSEAYRKQGIGRKLMNQAENWALQN